MKKIILAVALLVLLGCSTVEKQARDTAAALQGALVAAQTKYESTCVADKTQPACVTINKGVAAENALVTAVEAYCGWDHLHPPADPAAKCVPVKSATAALNSAIANATTITIEIKGAL